MKKILILLFLNFIIYNLLFSQINDIAIKDKLIINNFNKEYLNKYCINFIYKNNFYILSYESNIKNDNVSQRSIFLYRKENNNWKYASELIFVSNINYNNTIEFMDYPYPKTGNAIIKVLNDNYILLSMTYRERILGNNYIYPIIVLFSLNKLNNETFKHTIFVPNRLNNRYGIDINNINDIKYKISMNDKTNIYINFEKQKNNIKFVDELGNIMEFNN